MMRHLSLTTRLTTLFAIVASIALAILGVTMIALDKHFEAQDRDVLDGKIQLARNLVTRIDSSTSLAALPGQFRDAFVGHHDLAVTLLSPDGKTLYANEAVRFPAALLDHANAARKADFKQWQDGGRRLYGTAIAFSTRMPGTAPVIVAVAVDVNHHAVFISKFQRAMGMYVVVAALVCGLLGWLVVRQGLMPLYTMKERASSVTAGKLDLRMPIESVPVEMAELAATLNQMLGRLEDAFHRLSEFSANIAHELRTPISNLMTQTHVALSQARSNDEYRDILASNAEEFDRRKIQTLFRADRAIAPAIPGRIDWRRGGGTVRVLRSPGRGKAGRTEIDRQRQDQRRLICAVLSELVANARRTVWPHGIDPDERSAVCANPGSGRTRRRWPDRLACAWRTDALSIPHARIWWLASPAEAPLRLGIDFDDAPSACCSRERGLLVAFVEPLLQRSGNWCIFWTWVVSLTKPPASAGLRAAFRTMSVLKRPVCLTVFAGVGRASSKYRACRTPCPTTAIPHL
jgi:signal transduction histidine kinase